MVTNILTRRHRCCKRPRSSMGRVILRDKERAADETVTTTEALSSTSMSIAVALEAGLTGIDTSRRRLDKMSSSMSTNRKSFPSLGRSSRSRPTRQSSSLPPSSRISATRTTVRPSRWLYLSMILYSLFCVAVTFVECSNDGTTNDMNDSNNQHRDAVNAVNASEFFYPALPQSRMIGGSSASGKYSEYFVSWGSCAATLIYPDVALTAAHCSMKDSASVGGPNGQTTSIVSKTNHPNTKLDLAVLQLGGWFGDISTATLSRSDSNPSSSTLTLVGMSNGGRNLVQGNVELVEPDVCEELWSQEGFSIDADSMICAGSFTMSTSSSEAGDDDDDDDDDDDTPDGEGRDSVRACPGDSGSPLLDSSGVQVGVVSSGPRSCESSSLPVVYARVSAGYDWIAGNICSESKFPPWWCEGSSSNGEGTTVRVDIVYDGNPEDIEWSIEDGITGRKVAESEVERIDSSQISTFVELPDSAYVWIVRDSFGDGFKGQYQVVEVDRDGEDRTTIVSGDIKLVEDIVEVRFVIGSGFEEFLSPATTEANEIPTSGEQPDSDTGASDDDETLEPTSSPTEEVVEDDDGTFEDTEAPTEVPIEDDDEIFEDTEAPTEVPVENNDGTFEETEAPTEVPVEDDDGTFEETEAPTEVPVEDDDEIFEETEAPTEVPVGDNDETSVEDDDNDRRFLRHRRLEEDDGSPTVSQAPSVSMFPSPAPTGEPVEDTQTPSMSPTDIVTPSPSIETSSPTSAPTQGTPSPTSGPSENTSSPSIETSSPTSVPTQGTPSPTSRPFEDTQSPSIETSSPTSAPTQGTPSPTSRPSEDTPSPSLATSTPTMVPSQESSRPTSSVFSSGPSEETPIPTVSLTLSSSPTRSPSESTSFPTDETPTLLPTDESRSPSPTEEETASPSGVSTTVPPDSTEPTTSPTTTPAPSSSATTTSAPTGSLTEFPTAMPSETNTADSLSPTVLERDTPSSSPTVFSTDSFPPTTNQSPSETPTEEPTTNSPTEAPTTESPSAVPSASPTELFVTFLLGVNLEITVGPATSISWRIRDEESGQQVIGYREGWYTSTGQQFVGPVVLRNGVYEFELERSDVDAGASIDFFEVDILTGGTKPIDMLILDDQDDATVATVSFELTL
eukprot:CAMPEP_0113452668 /NCGR_PEP_ID=MMETSP0014_2-20120614/6964_1 /TAXON_ID=2857 /ORGANISM="Nitzschia sp." /LENGTH=1128 /DNA_ID=CAMNT_0000344045 /DNA_START=113 /DNA_END=3499 /DNA_ORIENTATION=- /assembly_acc=CAM_ASM_000159